MQYESFDKIDWYRYSKEIEKLEEERKALEQSSDMIESLQASIAKHQELYEETNNKLESKNQELGKLESSIEAKEDECKGLAVLLQNSNDADAEILQKLTSLQQEQSDAKLHLGNIVPTQTKVKEKIDALLKNSNEKRNRSRDKIIDAMGRYIRVYQAESKELDASISSLDEFGKKLVKLQKDNLPKWQKKFKELLKEKTIQGVVLLQANLEEQAKEILKKIERINLSLKDIEYSDGTYIELIAQKSNHAEIKQFKQDLKLVTSGAILDDNSYDEQKFLQIKGLIDRFNGREGFVDLDKKWRNKVSDVRNWFEFSASEKFLSDGSQKEFYAHSGGKSGGQKEKLAYTVLASSLAFQFGLEHNRVQSRSFRFVMIDEAFGRGSDESARYALRLFETLKLQLLVITPKQKINVIEPYVKSVHFVHNQDGMDSSLLSMHIEEYQKRKKG